MTREIPDSHALHRLFRGITEYTFMNELGIGDPNLVGYVADLLVRFVPAQTIWRLRNARGERLTEVTAMVAEAEASTDASRRYECHRHVGDFTLFWTGIYPDALDQLRASTSADHLVDFQAQGKRSYRLASELDGEEKKRPILRRLSDEFELYAFGLSCIRKEWERPDPQLAPRGLVA
ncbi:hypothetical protein [Singulisphaera sp. PoT]|uniref:hypothetical protein n=1 Tax=Singulisphaera sp. PoT TaxID=3411797 RepID=UPI003BF5C68E